MIKDFGIWQIIEGTGIVGNINSDYKYTIDKSRLWETTNRSGDLLYDWPVHLSEKTWMTDTIFNDLVAAMVFAQEHFAIENTGGVKNISWDRTIVYAKKNIGR